MPYIPENFRALYHNHKNKKMNTSLLQFFEKIFFEMELLRNCSYRLIVYYYLPHAIIRLYKKVST